MPSPSIKPHFKPSAADLYGPKAEANVAPSSSYAAASYDDPSLVGWYPHGGSADSDLLDELDTIVPRSRDLERNNGYVHGAKQTYCDNIIGHQLSVNPSPNREVLGWTPDQADAWSRQVRAQFETWFNQPTEIDATMMQNGRELTVQALAGWFMNGDSLAVPLWRPTQFGRWNTRLQAVETDRVETPPFMTGRKTIRKGIEYDRVGAIKAIWVRKTHPGEGHMLSATSSTAELVDGPYQYRRIPAFTPWGRRRFVMLMDKERPGQSRGRPMVTAIMREIRMAGHYTRTELQATIANSLVAGVLKSSLDPETAQSLFNSGTDRDDYWRSSFAKYAPKLKPGGILQLPLGADFESHVPGRPNQAFDAFMQSVLHNVAAGLGISYEVLAKDFSRTNYSSARATMLEVWRFFLSKRAWIEAQWLQPIYELWFEEAVNAGVISAPGYYENRHAYTRCSRWTMAGRGWVDPMKEAQGAQLRRRSRITNLKHECAEQGLDWRDVVDQAAIEEQYMREKGIDFVLPEAQTVATDSLDVKNDSIDNSEDSAESEDSEDSENADETKTSTEDDKETEA
jgi:lambda family phage portal protein